MPTSKPDIHRLFELQEFLLQFRDIKRIIRIPGKPDEQENDVEHSYHLALAAWFLAQHFPELDANKVIRYALVHDLVEVHAGDTLPWAKDGSVEAKADREAESLARIQQDWADFPEMLADMAAYESRHDEEAKFVYALDKVMPVMLAYMAKGHNWHKYDITIDSLHEQKITKVAISPKINDYYQQLYGLIQQHPEYFPDPKQQD